MKFKKSIFNTFYMGVLSVFFIWSMCSCDQLAVINPLGNDFEEGWTPENLSIEAKNDYTVRLSWEHLSDFEKGFIIERKISSQDFSEIARTNKDENTYLDVIQSSGEYTYRVRAFNKGYYSPYSEELTQTIDGLMSRMEFVIGSSFMMGSDSGDSDEMPKHQVTLQDFYIGKYEITHEEYLNYLNEEKISSDGTINQIELLDMSESYCAISHYRYYNQFYFVGNIDASEIDCPLMEVTWYGAIYYCNWLSKKCGLQNVYKIKGSDVTADFSKNGFRLPTEAEWEFSAKGGRLSENYLYSGGNDLRTLAWYYNNAGSKGSYSGDYGTHEVGIKNANELSLYDMSGNVWEWCWDKYSSSYYNANPRENPTGSITGEERVIRGGSWRSQDDNCRVSNRSSKELNHSGYDVGFRISKNADN